MICAGICYRRDSVDWQHTGTPHQLDLWRISRNVTLGESELEDMIERLVEHSSARARPTAPCPPSIRTRSTAARSMSCWTTSGSRSANAESPPPRYCARPASTRPGPDSRWAPASTASSCSARASATFGCSGRQIPRVAEQMLDLSPYKPVSAMPAVRRDLSIVVGPDADLSDEVLGDRVRASPGCRCGRRGIRRGAQRNVLRGPAPTSPRPPTDSNQASETLLIRLILRPVDHTLTDPEANPLRDQVYTALHEGPVLELIDVS